VTLLILRLFGPPAAGVANSEMTFGDEIQDPAPKRRKAGRKGKAAQQEEDAEGAVVSMQPSPSGTGAVALRPAAEMSDSEPAELSRTGAAEVAADADATLPGAQGETSHVSYLIV
jgi:hypothetical protein